MTIFKGFYVAVQENGHYPNTKYDGIYTPVGLSSNIAIKKSIYTKLSYPYSNCTTDTNTNYPEKYNREDCYEQCLQNKFIIPYCNCADPSIQYAYFIKDHPICFNQTSINCVFYVRKVFETTSLSKNCDKDCPMECNKTVYSMYLSSLSNYPTK